MKRIGQLIGTGIQLSVGQCFIKIPNGCFFRLQTGVGCNGLPYRQGMYYHIKLTPKKI